MKKKNRIFSNRLYRFHNYLDLRIDDDFPDEVYDMDWDLEDLLVELQDLQWNQLDEELGY